MDITKILGKDYKGSNTILDSFMKADSIINNESNKSIICSISGGV